MKKLFAFALIAMSVASAHFAHALENEHQYLDSSVLAELVISGGFMAPGVSNTTTYQIKTDGSVQTFSYVRGDFGPGKQSIMNVGKISAADQDLLERAIARIHSGELVDTNPSGPTGADAPNVSYEINQNNSAVTVGYRGGNFHVYALKQKAAAVIMKLLDKATNR